MDNQNTLSTMQELLENFICKGNSIKDKIIAEKDIYTFSKPLSKTEYEELCTYQDRGFKLENVQNYIKITTENSNLAIFVPYFPYVIDSLKFNASKLNALNVSTILSLASFIVLGLGYENFSSYFAKFGITSLLPNILSNTPSALLVFGTITPFLMSISILTLLVCANFANAELYKFATTKSFKNVFYSSYIPLMTIGLIFPAFSLIGFFYTPFSSISINIPLNLSLIIGCIINYLPIKNKKTDGIIALNYSIYLTLSFNILITITYAALLKFFQFNNNFWFGFGIFLLIAFIAPLSTMLFITNENLNPDSLQIKNITIRKIFSSASILSFILTLTLLVLAFFKFVNVFSVTGIGNYYDNIYVDKGLSKYKDILENLNYNEKTNEITPWVVVKTPHIIVMSKSKNSQLLYEFRRYPYELVKPISLKNSENNKKI